MLSYPLYTCPPPVREGEGYSMRGACMSISSMKAEIDRSPLFSHVTARLWQCCLSFRNQFCDAVVNNRLLTWDQMVSASCRYCIG